MSFGHALYYPSIHIPNEYWLKHSFLFWDKISRIVPSNYETIDNETVTKLQSETDFIENYYPEKSDINLAFVKFINSFKYLPYNSRVLNSFHMEYSHFFEKSEYLNPPSHEPSMKVDINKNSLIEKLLESRQEYGQSIYMPPSEERKWFNLTTKNRWSNLVRINSDFGMLYMRYLADIIAKKNSIPLITSTEEYYACQELPFNDEYNQKFEEKLGCLLIDTVLPNDINNVTIDQLINIKNKYNDQRIRYFNKIKEICDTLPTIDSESALKDALNYYIKSLESDTNELKKIYESNGINAMIKPLSISMPTAIASLSEIMPVEYKSLGVGTGLLYGVVSYFNELKKSQRETQRNPMSYLLSLESELNKENLFNRILNGLSGVYR